MHNARMYTHTRNNHFMALFRDYPGEPVPEEIFLWTSVVQGKITKQAHRPFGWAPLCLD